MHARTGEPLIKLLTLALVLVLFAGCGKDEDNDSSEESWEFINTADEPAFKAQLSDLTTMLGRAPLYQAVPSHCPDLETNFSLNGLGSQENPLSLTDGMQCAGALAAVRAQFHSSVLTASESAQLLQLDAPAPACGSTFTKLVTDDAATSYRIEPQQVKLGERRHQTVFGGANDTEIGLLNKMRYDCRRGSDCGDESMISLIAETETLATPAEHSLAFASDFSLHKERGTADHLETTLAHVTSHTTIEGLEEGGAVALTETVDYKVETTNPQIGYEKTTSKSVLNISQSSPGTWHVSGSYQTADAEVTAQTLDFYLVESGDQCLSYINKPDDTEQPYPVQPVPPVLSTDQIEGTWVSPCEYGSMERFGSGYFQETVNLKNQKFKYTMKIFSDNECRPDSEQAVMTWQGKYALGERLSGSSNAEYAFDFIYSSYSVKLGTGLVGEFAGLCGREEWLADETYEQLTGADGCWFQTGSDLLVSMETLQRQKEYRSISMETSQIIVIPQTNHWLGDTADARASGTYNARRFKKQD